ncbi:hypothetical protein MAR_000335 [Mya arenaria]|uniref:Uncharacterized protein n=1 Tax=Mya arenaria TaxID=6604 RepID=A0ABY7FA74_MYAAR|nr:hypothetical protein MAR_000335 [Mya arenaria]
MGTLVKQPGTKGEHHGPWNYEATLLSEALSRPSLLQDDGDDEEVIVFKNDMDIDEHHGYERIRATYDDKTSKDFVPAARSAETETFVSLNGCEVYDAQDMTSLSAINMKKYVVCKGIVHV